MTSFLQCAYLQATASIAKLAWRLAATMPDPRPDQVIAIPSRDKDRTIKTNIYHPASKAPGPSAVVVNFHGSGWILPCHGESDNYCRTIAQSTEYTVLDASYRLAPTIPFPGAQDDGEDVIKYVLDNPDLYDGSRIVLSGFSAGGHTALVLASTTFPANTFSKLILFYPAVNLSLDPNTLGQPDPNITPLISSKALSLMRACYVQDKSIGLKDPRLSPSLGSLANVPSQTLMVTAAADNITLEVELCVARLRADSKRVVQYRKFEKCNHAFDVSPKAGSVEEEAQQEAYSLVIEMLQG